jgi:hypothetical protein
MIIKYTLKYKRYKFIVFATDFLKAVEQLENDLDENVNNRLVNIVSAIKIF